MWTWRSGYLHGAESRIMELLNYASGTAQSRATGYSTTYSTMSGWLRTYPRKLALFPFWVTISSGVHASASMGCLTAASSLPQRFPLPPWGHSGEVWQHYKEVYVAPRPGGASGPGAVQDDLTYPQALPLERVDIGCHGRQNPHNSFGAASFLQLCRRLGGASHNSRNNGGSVGQHLLPTFI